MKERQQVTTLFESCTSGCLFWTIMFVLVGALVGWLGSVVGLWQ